MAEAEGIPPTASVGKELQYIGGGYWGAWSGSVISNAGTTTALEFVCPENIVASISWATDLDALGNGDLIKIEILLNDEIVYRYRSKNEAARAIMDIDPIKLMIPGNFTKFKMTIYTQTGADTITTFNLVGRQV